MKIGDIDVAQFIVGAVGVVVLVSLYTLLLYTALRAVERHARKGRD